MDPSASTRRTRRSQKEERDPQKKGDILQQYDRKEKIGEGTYGVVYRVCGISVLFLEKQ